MMNQTWILICIHQLRVHVNPEQIDTRESVKEKYHHQLEFICVWTMSNTDSDM